MLLRQKASLAVIAFSILALVRPVWAQEALGQTQPAVGAQSPLASDPAGAVPRQVLNYGVDAGVGETDNVNLAPTDKVSQTLAVADADIDIDQQRRLFSVDAKGSFNYLDFLQGAYSPELIGRFDGLGTGESHPGNAQVGRAGGFRTSAG